mmetsp:Transcript_477/g.1544  ORF Transcript_477/g.1544 Transcript_477/m.1544 type:complete len:243 (-) Transcript_477:69-797(-)
MVHELPRRPVVELAVRPPDSLEHQHPQRLNPVAQIHKVCVGSRWDRGVVMLQHLPNKSSPLIRKAKRDFVHRAVVQLLHERPIVATGRKGAWVFKKLPGERDQDHGVPEATRPIEGLRQVRVPHVARIVDDRREALKAFERYLECRRIASGTMVLDTPFGNECGAVPRGWHGASLVAPNNLGCAGFARLNAPSPGRIPELFGQEAEGVGGNAEVILGAAVEAVQPRVHPKTAPLVPNKLVGR